MERILVSACLLGEKVRYDGGDCATHGLLDVWQQQGRIVPFCPEIAGGLTVPRPAAEIQCGTAGDVLTGTARVKRSNGTDVTGAFVDGAERALAQCWEHHIKIAVLKEGSPSCGSAQVNDGRFSGRKIKGQGVTANLLSGHGISVFSERDLSAANKRLDELEKTHDE